jgi:hypothetical protein
MQAHFNLNGKELIAFDIESDAINIELCLPKTNDVRYNRKAKEINGFSRFFFKNIKAIKPNSFITYKIIGTLDEIQFDQNIISILKEFGFSSTMSDINKKIVIIEVKENKSYD